MKIEIVMLEIKKMVEDCWYSQDSHSVVDLSMNKRNKYCY